MITEHPLATDAAARMLDDGGGVADAALAAAAVLSVVRPDLCGLGGEAFALYRDGETGRVEAIGPPPNSTTDTATAPSFGPLFLTLHERFGRRSRPDVVAPAAQIAEVGFALDPRYAIAATDTVAQIRRRPADATASTFLLTRLLDPGPILEPASRLRLPELAEAWRIIGRSGQEAIESGPIAAGLVGAAARVGPPLTYDDLRRTPILRRPPVGRPVTLGRAHLWSGGWTPAADPPPGLDPAPIARLVVVGRDGSALAAAISLGRPFGRLADASPHGFMLGSGPSGIRPVLLIAASEVPSDASAGPVIALAGLGAVSEGDDLIAVLESIAAGEPPVLVLERSAEAGRGHLAVAGLVPTPPDTGPSGGGPGLHFTAAQTPSISGPGRVRNAQR